MDTHDDISPCTTYLWEHRPGYLKKVFAEMGIHSKNGLEHILPMCR